MFMKKKVVSIVLALVLAGLAYGFYLYNKPRTDLAGLRPTVIIDAISLYKAYQTDEPSSDKKYLNQVIEVNGTITDIQQTDSLISLELNAAGSGGVNCSIPNVARKKIGIPTKGSSVKIKGRCTGFLMDVNLVDCVIEN
jgi:hypothetical protein